jgi:hypothetical protein
LSVETAPAKTPLPRLDLIESGHGQGSFYLEELEQSTVCEKKSRVSIFNKLILFGKEKEVRVWKK